MSESKINTEQEYIEQIDYLNKAYSAAVSENIAIKSSRTYRFSLLLKTIIVKLHLFGLVQFLLDVRRNGIKQAWRDYRSRKSKAATEANRTTKLIQVQRGRKESQEIQELLEKKDQYALALNRDWSIETKKITELLEQRIYKGIMVCPNQKNGKISEKAIQLMSAIAGQGFLCFLCESGSNKSGVEEKSRNFFVIHSEENLLPALQNKCPVVFVTDFSQAAFVETLPQSIVWVDIQDNASYSKRNAWETEICNKLLSKAALITYSDDKAKPNSGNYANLLRLDISDDFSQTAWTTCADEVIARLAGSHEGLKALADFHINSSVAVISVTFFKYDGTTYYSGGAERYLLDLYEVCKELNVNYRIYQYGEYDWVRFYNQIEVVGLNAKENDVNKYGTDLINEMDSLFNREVTQENKLNIYSPFYIISRKGFVPSVGISHGISWDNERNHYIEGSSFWNANKNIIDSAGNCDQMISVDTNTCNWFQTLDYNTGRKIHYIPNYVDNQEFYPRDNYLEQQEKVVITYPRRLYGARGLYVVLDVIDDILSKYPNVEFHFVGKGFEQDTKHVEKKIEKWGERVKWYSKAPNQMHEVYKMTDISLIPTMYSEGTSLSCLEALSSGNVVIATRVGGLTDLILSDYNGKLVEPTGKAIKEALFDLLDHPEKMSQLKKNAVETARAFSKSKWKKQWKQRISEFVSEEENCAAHNRCMVKLGSKDDLNKSETVKLIREHLEAGWYVYVACKNNPMRYDSYKRLQYVDLDEDLYFTPEKIITV